MKEEYKYIASKFYPQLEIELNQAIQQGWTLCPGSIKDDSGYIMLLLKRELEEEITHETDLGLPIVEYGIVMGRTANEFIKSMSEALAQDWQPHGFPFFDDLTYPDGTDEIDFSVIQAVTRCKAGRNKAYKVHEMRMLAIQEALASLEQKKSSESAEQNNIEE